MVEDFSRAIHAVGNNSFSNSNEDVASPSASRGADVADVGGLVTNALQELDDMQRVVATLPPDATAADLHKTLGEHNKLQNQLVPRTRARALKAAQSGPLDTTFISIAKKYALLYHLWNPDNQFMPLAPILFQDPDQMDAQGCFKNKMLTQMACVLLDGKGVLTRKRCGSPPGRGRKLGATTVTEGMIAVCCTFARYLLSGDDEFSPPTHKEWPLGVLAHFNDVVFGADWQASVTSINNINDTNNPVGGQTKSWEDDIMDQFGDSESEIYISGLSTNFSPTSRSSSNPSILLSKPFHLYLAMHTCSAQPAVNPNLPYQPTIAMNSPLGISTAQAPMGMPSISGSGNIWTLAHAIPGPVQVQNTLDIHVPLVNLSLANGQSSQPLGESVSAAMNINTGPVVIPALVNIPSSKASWSKKGKKPDHAEGVTEVPVRATWSKVK
ncbi:hypothetical protein V8E55_009451 [Tylopilus felleus]